MDAYTSFASVYDTFMDNVPYREWGEYLHGLLEENGIRDGILLDLGCGTGTMTEILAGFGYDMIGVDNSEDMLEIAMEKKEASGHDILYLLQDMREFELIGKVDAIVSLCDSLNYITEKADLLEVFKRVHDYLEKDGLFIFDINTIYKFQNILSDNSFCETTENSAYTWENYYDEEEKINEFYTNFFVENSDGLYERYEEFHYEKGYTIEEIKELLGMAGLEFEAVYDELTFEEPKENSQKIFFVAKVK
mgnify:CR=1 FL=1